MNDLKHTEFLKKQVAEQLLSNEKFKAVHSIQSIKKLLDREGLNQPTRLSIILY